MGNASARKCGPNRSPSASTNSKNTASVSAKLMREDTFLDNRNRYFGTLTLLMMSRFCIRLLMPPVVESLK